MSLTCTYIDHGEGGTPDSMKIATRPMEAPKGRQVLIEVEYAGVNRPDVLQRAGSYPPPPGASPYLGLEVSGRIIAIGADVRDHKVGDIVCALTPGGGYAQYCLTDERQCLPVPKGMDMLHAAAIPENYFTVWTNLFDRAALKPGETLLVHGGSSGIGLTAIQLAHAIGATVWTTVGNAEKAAACTQAGADHTILYRDQDFEQVLRDATNGQGVDVIIDMVGGNYINKNLHSLALNGRLVQIAFLESSEAHIDARPIMIKRLSFTGSTLRPRTDDDKAAIGKALVDQVFPLMESGRCLPLIHRVFPLDQAVQAHQLMESSTHIGKIMLQVKD